jgi:hypothetical protein
LWHLQKFLQYINVEFTPSISLLYFLLPIPGIVSTGLFYVRHTIAILTEIESADHLVSMNILMIVTLPVFHCRLFTLLGINLSLGIIIFWTYCKWACLLVFFPRNFILDVWKYSWMLYVEFCILGLYWIL